MTEDSRLDHENSQDGSGAGEFHAFADQAPERTYSGVAGPNEPEQIGFPDANEPSLVFLELVYGVLFEPGKTMKKVAARPPLGLTALVVTIISLIGAVMGLLTVSKVLNQSLHAMAMEQFLPGLRAMAPLGAVFGLLWGYVKWFGHSAIIHLAAELLGGRGSARGVFAAVGLAWLPAIFMIPIQFLNYWLGTGKLAVTILVGLAGLAVGIWSIILMVIGLREVHGLSTGRSVLVVFSPILALLMLGILMIITLVAIAASMPDRMHLPGYF